MRRNFGDLPIRAVVEAGNLPHPLLENADGMPFLRHATSSHPRAMPRRTPVAFAAGISAAQSRQLRVGLITMADGAASAAAHVVLSGLEGVLR